MRADSPDGPLTALRVVQCGATAAVAYAGRLLGLLGAQVRVVATDLTPAWPHDPAQTTAGDAAALRAWSPQAVLHDNGAPGLVETLARDGARVTALPAQDDPQDAWAHSGGMALTGPADGAPLAVPGAHASHLRGAAAAFALLADLAGATVALDGPALVGERAALLNLRRQGLRTCGGMGRLLRWGDGWLALGLPRSSDRDLVGAWLEATPPAADADGLWEWIARRIGDGGEHLPGRARLLGLPCAPVIAPSRVWAERSPATLSPFATLRRPASAAAHPPPRRRRPIVVELASLWAGPLATSLLARAGARVIKVEGPAHPDGARRGPAAFFDLLNAGKESVALDLRGPQGPAALMRLVEHADLVVEAMRPRALANLGVDPVEMAERHGVSWIRLSGYGVEGPGANWAAFGDDAAVAGGAAWAATEEGRPHFLADAYADPVTGLHAAVAGLACLSDPRGGHVLGVSMRDTVAHLFGDLANDPEVSPAPRRWAGPVAPPRARAADGRAAALGAHTAQVVADLGIGPWPS